MISFVNAKINIGLYITSRRSDGYHNLNTLFYPVGIENGTPGNPAPFCDILEIVPSEAGEDRLILSGNPIDCPLEKNLVWRAACLFRLEYEKKGCPLPYYDIFLEKHLPDGAGLGGGSADASFTLLMLNKLSGGVFSEEELMSLAMKLGADCPFFIRNCPAVASGIGEVLHPVSMNLSGWWCVVVKPDIHISTKEAFSRIVPQMTDVDLSALLPDRMEDWKDFVRNDFEDSLFPNYPQFLRIKENLYDLDAVYASLTGSGAAVYGLFKDSSKATRAFDAFSTTQKGVWLLKLK